ncbi:hypothetical protein DRO59_00690 [Candidatus Bathyarchaeota archaeon]|nr:MAG: hypothetical protein DRO59_00690 [Candidatus Bathyarchaeota archaeon]
MPVYKCPNCGRTVELPEGTYYCRECGPEFIMEKVSSSPAFVPRRYSSAPEKCYCEKCGSEIDMEAYGLYGKHCREIEYCPVCGAGGHPLWRTPR